MWAFPEIFRGIQRSRKVLQRLVPDLPDVLAALSKASFGPPDCFSADPRVASFVHTHPLETETELVLGPFFRAVFPEVPVSVHGFDEIPNGVACKISVKMVCTRGNVVCVWVYPAQIPLFLLDRCLEIGFPVGRHEQK